MIRIAAAFLLCTLAACAKTEEASLVPPQDEGGYNMVDPVAAPLAQEGQLAVGEWAAVNLDDQPGLTFGPAGTEPLFSLRCDGRNGIALQRHGVIVGPGMNMMVVEVGGRAERLAVTPVEGSVPLLRASAPAQSELVGSLGGAQNQLGIRIGTGEPLVLPASPLLADLVRGCAAPGPEVAAETNQAEASPEPANAATPTARTPG